MNPLFSSNLVLLVLSLLGIAVVLGGPMLIYGYLADRVWFEGQGRVQAQGFGFVDACIAAGLILVLAWSIVRGFAVDTTTAETGLPNGTAMIYGVIVTALLLLLLMAGIVGSLVLRNHSWLETLGMGRIGVATVFSRAVLLLFLALPLIYGTLALTHILLAGGGYSEDNPQELVRFLAARESGMARIVVIVSAVFIAPFQEEFIFRGFIYGVVRRYAGPFVGVVVNAALFAGIHLNAPSLGGLFVLAVCLTLAYEWTGSLFVPITMHALFNALSIISLLSGDGRN